MPPESRHLGVHVDRPLDRVCAFVADPANLPRWAAGLDPGARVTFVPANPFGVLDHDVETPSGETVHVPLRALPDGDGGCEVVFTVRREPGVSDADFERDLGLVATDLQRLREAVAAEGAAPEADPTASPGSWTGTGTFRLLPTDPPRAAPAAATTTPGAGGRLASIAYTWSHPDDGPQEGLLVLGPGPGDAVLALWGDTWHQSPEARSLTGSRADGVTTVGYDHVAGEWRWRIVVDARGGDVLGIRMENVALASTAPPYAAMDLVLRRR